MAMANALIMVWVCGGNKDDDTGSEEGDNNGKGGWHETTGHDNNMSDQSIVGLFSYLKL